MKIEQLNVDELIPYARNAKLHNDAQVASLAGSIKEFGFNNPVLIDNEGSIIAGHGRVLAARKLKLKTVPCIRLSHLNENQKRAYIIADNRLSETGGGWDRELLEMELKDIDFGDFKNFSLDDLGDFEFPEIEYEKENNTHDDTYTRKVEAPQYQITRDSKPAMNELFNNDKYEQLIKAINKSKISNEDKEFLRIAATRHIVFDYSAIAEFYAHSDKNVQELMEQSALVIIDFDDAIKNGFVKFTNDIKDMFLHDKGSDEEENNEE